MLKCCVKFVCFCFLKLLNGAFWCLSIGFHWVCYRFCQLTSAFMFSIRSVIIFGVVAWCDSAGKLPVPGRPTIWIQYGKGLLCLQ